jgi:hypothetical protein
MQFAARKIALERQLMRKARQRAAFVARGRHVTGSAPPTEEVAESSVPVPLLAYDKEAVARLLAKGQRRGYITFDDLNTIFPETCCSADEIESFFLAFYKIGIDIVEVAPSS